ncbi:MAG: acyl-CoA dehydrogenase [Cyanobacteriota bacterium]|nr:acyl-CoA dehydrogenase [Cyanobacteriota bacterium]
MEPLKQYWLAEKLEQDLGPAENPDSTMSFKRVVEIDESEAFPVEEIQWLYDWKLQHYYIPVEFGGEFTSFEELVSFVRVLCRRDQNIGIAMTTLFWSFLSWMAGTDEQRAHLSNEIKNNNGTLCLGYSEREHGADLIAGDLTARKVEGGYILNGEKWPINRATRSTNSYILATTDPEAGARGLSLFLVDKSRIDPNGYYNLPKILTHGIRAADMSGIGFKDCFVPEDMRLKEEGTGLEIALKGFQITRTLCAAFSHGAADTALRTTLNFALGRVIYGKTVFEIPHARQTLVNGFLDLLICDCETISSARGFHTVPEQFSIWAAVVKYFVTVQLEKTIDEISVVLGSRFYMRDEHDWGIYQKMLRDNAVISVFDGSTVVNLHALILQMRQITKARSRRKPKQMDAIAARLEATFSLEKPVPPFQPEKLELFGRGADDVLQGLEIAIAKLQDLNAQSHLSAEVLEQIKSLAGILLEELDAIDDLVANSAFEFGHDQSPELFDLAKKYCTLHAGASCLHMWLYNRQRLGTFFEKGEWLVLGLNRLLQPFGRSQKMDPAYIENVADELLKLHQDSKMYSIVPFQLAKPQTQEKNADATSELQLQA